MSAVAERPAVWIVDDSPLEAEFVRRTIASEYATEVFASGAPLLEKLSGEPPPALVILDLNLPDIPGLELCRFIRTRVDARELPVLILTTVEDKASLVEAFAAGANDYVTKPAEAAELRARVNALARVRRLALQARRAEELREKAELEVRAERERLHGILTYAPAAICLLRGPELRCDFANPRFLELCGAPELVGKTLGEGLAKLASHPMFGVLDDVYASGETYVAQVLPFVQSTERGPAELFLKVTYLPTRDAAGAVNGIHVFAFDVTEQTVGRRKMEELLSLASHELKTPLTSMQLQIHSLRKLSERSAGGLDVPRLNKGLTSMERQVKRQGRLVEELLDVSRLTGGKMRLEVEELDVAELVREVALRFEEDAFPQPCHLEFGALSPVTAELDRLRMDQVVTNLISNALKYGEGQPIDLRLEAVGVRRMRLSVRDRGIGIDGQHLDRIFAPFERAVSDRNYAGLGLGLWITRRLVEAMGGTITVSSTLGKGSTFMVELPRSQETTDPEARALTE